MEVSFFNSVCLETTLAYFVWTRPSLCLYFVILSSLASLREGKNNVGLLSCGESFEKH